MSLNRLVSRLQGRYRRTMCKTFGRRPYDLPPGEPLVSFSFDDFPRSALLTAGEILKSHGAIGTYYTSLGLAGSTAPTGEIFQQSDLASLLGDGHELGCHTYSHCPAATTPTAEFEGAVIENRKALHDIIPEARFETLSYPIGSARPRTKQRCGRHFRACRGGGQTYNLGRIDLNLLNAYFIEQSVHVPDDISRIIAANAAAGGWLIFATHDVAEHPTRFGCTPQLFERVVRESRQSGAQVLSVGAALTSRGVPPLSCI
jgi:peptidoglycan/xylan/chitin deacetylase (PgdA/CDA1 family)